MFIKQLSLVLRIIFLMAPLPAFTQHQKTTNPQLAPVSVIVTDFKNVPRFNEQIIFISKKNGLTFSSRSGKDGRFFLQLPQGDTFVIKIKTMVDSTKYGVIAIRQLDPDERFADPFAVTVKFEPKKSYTLDNVHFDSGKASLRPDSYPELNELVSYLEWKKDDKIEIAGHTDNVGNDLDNLKLSQQRAESIKQYLVKKGVNATRVIAKGYGATMPIADNNSDDGKQRNRRTEVKIL